jgi:hypothetical protein
MSAADLVIWYSHTFDAIAREQADERATAIGGNNVGVVDLVAPGVDEYILENQSEKFSITEDLARSGMRNALERMRI